MKRESALLDRQRMKILVVTTSNTLFDGPNPHPTGVWLSEFTEPYMQFHENGIELTVASPKGGQMPIDPRTLPTPEQQTEWMPALQAASRTLTLDGLEAADFDAIFLPGGHGPMFDLPENRELQRINQAGHAKEFAVVERAAGLAFDASGDLIVGSSIGSGKPGIYRVAHGTAQLIVPMPEAVFLNGLTHLHGSRFLVADSYRSLIWEVDTEEKSSRIWIEHQSLAHAADPFHPVPQFPGVNGLRIFNGTVYASSTEQQKLIRIPLKQDFTPGTPEVFMTTINLDDFAFDDHGNVYGTTHIYNSVVKITPERLVTVIAGLAEGVAGSTAAAFGRTEADRTTLYVTTNGGMSAPPEGGVQSGRVIKIEVGATGYFTN